MKLLREFYAAVYAFSMVATGVAVLAGLLLLVIPVRNPGRMIGLLPILRRRTDARVRALVREAEGALNGLGIQRSTDWGGSN
ncbi:hypothetical protein ACFV3T_29335 [Streptomyces albidoflavus]